MVNFAECTGSFGLINALYQWDYITNAQAEMAKCTPKQAHPG